MEDRIFGPYPAEKIQLFTQDLKSNRDIVSLAMKFTTSHRVALYVQRPYAVRCAAGSAVVLITVSQNEGSAPLRRLVQTRILNAWKLRD